jgi:hypothetical protein
VDPRQAKAFINWGRVVGLRAEMARDAGTLSAGLGWAKLAGLGWFKWAGLSGLG